MSTEANLRELHQAAGSPSFRSIERQLVLRFGESVPSAETLRLYHHGRVKSYDTAVVGMLAWYYDVAPAEISEEAGRVLVLLGGAPPDPTAPGGDSPAAAGTSGSGATMRGCPQWADDLPIGDVYGGARAS